MKKLTQKQEAEKWKAVADAFFRFVQKNPPEGFNRFAMVLFAQSGRTDELITLLDKFEGKSQEVAHNEKAE